jgi:hypothetical protein
MQTVTSFAPIVDALVTLAGAVITVCVPIVTLKLTNWLGVKMDSEHRDALNAAIETALGKALQFGQAAGDSALANVTIKNAALSAAVTYVDGNAGEAVAFFGLTDAGIAEKLAARLAKLLHVTNDAPASDPAKAEATAAMLKRTENLAPVVAAPPVIAQSII